MLIDAAAELISIHERARALLGVRPEVAGDAAVPPRIDRVQALSDELWLSPLELRVLFALFAAEYDPLLRLFARHVQGGIRTGLEVGTLAELLAIAAEELPALVAALEVDGTLHRQALVAVDDPSAPAVTRQARLESRLARHLIGEDTLPEHFTVAPAPSGMPDLAAIRPPLDETVARLRQSLVEREQPVLQIVGAPGVGKRDIAGLVAHALDMPLVIVDLSAAERSKLGRMLRGAQLEARLRGAALCLTGWDAPAKQPAADTPAEPQSAEERDPMRALLGLLRVRPPLLILCSPASHARSLRDLDLPVAQLDVAFPNPSERARILDEEARALGHPQSEEVLELLARRFALPPRRLRAALRGAAQEARALDRTVDGEALAAACRAQLSHELEGVADRVSSHHRLEDLVVSADITETLGEMISFVRHSKLVHETWGFARRHSLTESVSALFAGPPGTGKTMCASAMADALGCEVFRVDLSRVISKWIGETEKNLSRVFDEAERSGAILLFDEADSLFARRTAVNSATDRYANLAVNFLLQRMDSFRGITILTTNNEDAIDPAFRRRLTFRLRFEKPDAAERAELWRKVFPAAATIADDFDPDVLAHIAELSGAGIRNAAVRAAFLAASLGRTIDMELCSNAAIREAAEMGMLTCLPRSHQGPREIAHIEPQPQPQRALGAGARTIPITHPRRNGTMG